MNESEISQRSRAAQQSCLKTRLSEVEASEARFAELVEYAISTGYFPYQRAIHVLAARPKGTK
jgi:hypothetical protein